MKCINCGKPITRIPKRIEQVYVHQCGTEYYVMVGDQRDVLESILDYLDLLLPSELEHISINDKIEVEHGGKKITAVLLEKSKEEDIENFGIDLWMVFIERRKGEEIVPLC